MRRTQAKSSAINIKGSLNSKVMNRSERKPSLLASFQNLTHNKMKTFPLKKLINRQQSSKDKELFLKATSWLTTTKLWSTGTSLAMLKSFSTPMVISTINNTAYLTIFPT